MHRAFILICLVFLKPVCVQAADDWHFLLAPYVWFAGAKGDLSTVPGQPATGIDISAIDALKGTEASFMLMFEAKKRRHGVLFDVFYSDVLQENQAMLQGGLSWKASLKETLITAGYTYEVYKTPQAVINAIGGLRYWGIDTSVQFRSGSGAAPHSSVHDSESWVDPLLGLDAKVRLGDSPAYLAGFLGAGGASAGSDGFYDLTATVGYQLTDSIVASIGYRLFDVDYKDDAFVYDVKQQGWLLGLVWIFGTNKLAPPA